MNKLVSVIIPFHNNEDFVMDILESIESQTYENIELICIDDGSTDKTYDFLKSYIPSRIHYKVLRNNYSHGSSYARNKGLSQAIGDYIYFMDSDDKIDNSLLSDNIALLEETGTDLVIFGHTTFEVNGKKKIFHNVNHIEEYSANTFKKRYDSFFEEDVVSFFLWNKLYKRSIIEENNIRFDCNQVFGEDALFNFEYYKAMHKVVFNPKLYYSYIRRKNSISGSRKMDYDRFKDEMKVIEGVNEVLIGDYTFSVRRLVRILVRLYRLEGKLCLNEYASSIIVSLSLPAKYLSWKDKVKQILISIILNIKY